MGEILGLGMTHYPSLAVKGDFAVSRIKDLVKDPGLPERYRTPEGWPEGMRREWSDDEGRSAAERHRAELVAQFRRVKGILDQFAPDFVVVWGDDQYENFKEDVVPAFCVMAYDSMEVRPWEKRRAPNSWDEPEDKTFQIPGHRAGGKFLAAGLLQEGFDVAYSYEPLHHPLGHAFLNAILYMDWDRRGWDHAVVPFAVNCYGRRLIAQRGSFQSITESPGEGALDPPSPPPWRCFDLGAAARVLARSPWRVALIASSSWSHSFLTPKNYFLFPDVEADRSYYEALRTGDYARWRNTTTEEIEDRGHQELLNWFCLAGAMAELGRRPDECIFFEKYIGHCKVFAVFNP